MATLSALPVHPRSWAALLERDDIVLDQGVLRLRHDAHDARRRAHRRPAARRATRSKRPASRVLLVRHDVRIPALVVDVADAAAAVAALRAAARAAVRQAQGARQRSWPPSSTTRPSAPPSIRVYRPRISEHGELRYDHEIGIRVEFWRFGEELVEAPHDNAAHAPAHAGEPTSTSPTSSGTAARWRTIAGMFDVHPARVHRGRRHGLLVGRRLLERVPAPARRADGRVRRRRGR